MINLNQFRIFYHVAEHQSITLAAKALFITQPAVTVQMKTFEEACGLKLFKKRGRGIQLTDAGRSLFEHARRFFEHEKEIEGIIEDLRELKTGVLRVGTSKAYARYIMPFLISTYHQAHPEIKILLNEGSSLEVINRLFSFDNEVAMVAKAEDNPQVQFIPFSMEEVVLIAAPRHELGRRQAISVDELAEFPLIMKESGSATRKVVEELFARHGCSPTILMETSNTEFIKQLVVQGDGVAFLIRETVFAAISENRLVTVPLREEKVYLEVCICHIKEQPISLPAQAFVSMVGKIAGEHMLMDGIRSLISDQNTFQP